MRFMRVDLVMGLRKKKFRKHTFAAGEVFKLQFEVKVKVCGTAYHMVLWLQLAPSTTRTATKSGLTLQIYLEFTVTDLLEPK